MQLNFSALSALVLSLYSHLLGTPSWPASNTISSTVPSHNDVPSTPPFIAPSGLMSDRDAPEAPFSPTKGIDREEEPDFGSPFAELHHPIVEPGAFVHNDTSEGTDSDSVEGSLFSNTSSVPDRTTYSGIHPWKIDCALGGVCHTFTTTSQAGIISTPASNITEEDIETSPSPECVLGGVCHTFTTASQPDSSSKPASVVTEEDIEASPCPDCVLGGVCWPGATISQADIIATPTSILSKDDTKQKVLFGAVASSAPSLRCTGAACVTTEEDIEPSPSPECIPGGVCHAGTTLSQADIIATPTPIPSKDVTRQKVLLDAVANSASPLGCVGAACFIATPLTAQADSIPTHISGAPNMDDSTHTMSFGEEKCVGSTCHVF